MKQSIFGLRSSVFGLRSSVFGLRSSVFGLRSSVLGLLIFFFSANKVECTDQDKPTIKKQASSQRINPIILIGLKYLGCAAIGALIASLGWNSSLNRKKTTVENRKKTAVEFGDPKTESKNPLCLHDSGAHSLNNPDEDIVLHFRNRTDIKALIDFLSTSKLA